MSLKIDNAAELLNHLAVHVEKINKKSKKSTEQEYVGGGPNLFRLGQIDPNYSSGRPNIIFSGETKISLKKYPYLSSYVPKAGDKVLLIRVSNSYVVMGKII